MRFTSAIAAAATLFLASLTGSVLAASSATATVSGITFELIDLDPHDGLAPSMSFLSGQGRTLLNLSVRDDHLGEAEAQTRQRPGTFTVSADFLSNLSQASAHAVVQNTVLSAAGSAAGPQTEFSAQASTGSQSGVFSPDSPAFNLALSPHSQLLIHAAAHLSASAVNPTDCSQAPYGCDDSGVTESATAYAALNLSFLDLASGQPTPVYAPTVLSLTASASAAHAIHDYQYNPITGEFEFTDTVVEATEQSLTLDTALSASFSNTTDQAQSMALGISVVVNGLASTPAGLSPSSPSSVPEPEWPALALAGLASLGCWHRRARVRA